MAHATRDRLRLVRNDLHAIRFLAVGGKEIAKPRTQITSEVFDDDRDAIGVRIEIRVQVCVPLNVCDCLLAKCFVIAIGPNDVAEIRRPDSPVSHSLALLRSRLHQTPDKPSFPDIWSKGTGLVW